MWPFFMVCRFYGMAQPTIPTWILKLHPNKQHQGHRCPSFQSISQKLESLQSKRSPIDAAFRDAKLPLAVDMATLQHGSLYKPCCRLQDNEMQLVILKSPVS